jgi:hypothetical protein
MDASCTEVGLDAFALATVRAFIYSRAGSLEAIGFVTESGVEFDFPLSNCSLISRHCLKNLKVDHCG